MNVENPLITGPSLLDRASSAQVVSEPFPHLIVENALPGNLVSSLQDELVPLANLGAPFFREDNKRVDLISSSGPSRYTLEDAAPPWREFLLRHSSADFVREVLDIFSEHLESAANRLKEPISSGCLGGFDEDWGRRQCNVHGRATIGINTPLRAPSSVRGPHVDSAHKAYVGLFYLRHPEDQKTAGGDLALYRWRDGKDPRPRWPAAIDPMEVQQVRTIPYRTNSFVLFLNTDDAVHGVTPRAASTFPRFLTVVSGWFDSAPSKFLSAPSPP